MENLFLDCLRILNTPLTGQERRKSRRNSSRREAVIQNQDNGTPRTIRSQGRRRTILAFVCASNQRFVQAPITQAGIAGAVERRGCAKRQ